MNLQPVTSIIPIEKIIKASYHLHGIIRETPLQLNQNLSDKYEANIYIKREDLQIVRSYKIRGAYHKMASLDKTAAKRGVVCASAGNHAQGFAYSCKLLGIQGNIYMPITTPAQKIRQVERLGKDKVNVVLIGDTFDDAFNEAMAYCEENNKIFVHPFDDLSIVEGQGTVGLEILNQLHHPIDYLFIPLGGGGLSAGVGSYFKKLSPVTKIIGVEPENAGAMKASLAAGKRIELAQIDTFVDGAAVKKVGKINFEICQQVLKEVTLIPAGKVCTEILSLYNEDAIVVEPAGVLGIAALDFHREKIKGKTVVCVITGGNNDIERMPDIRERSLIYEGLKHYFIIQFPQRAGALRDFLDKVLQQTDDITHFEYRKKTNRNMAPAVVGIEVKNKEDYTALLKRMDGTNMQYTIINDNPDLFNFLI